MVSSQYGQVKSPSFNISSLPFSQTELSEVEAIMCKFDSKQDEVIFVTLSVIKNADFFMVNDKWVFSTSMCKIVHKSYVFGRNYL